MRKIILILSFSLYFVSQEVDAGMRHYNLCPNLQSFYFSDPLRNRAIIINYDPARRKFIFMRCGESDSTSPSRRTQNLGCHITREVTEDQMCQQEKVESRVARVIAEVIDAGTSAAISGGLSNLSKINRTIRTLRDLNLTPQCSGTSLMKAMVTNTNTYAQTEAYYQSQTELGPMTGLTRFSTRSRTRRENYIYTQLDALAAPGVRDTENNQRRVALRGPQYFTAQRNNQLDDQLVLDSPGHAAFCRHVTGTTEPDAPEEASPVSS